MSFFFGLLDTLLTAILLFDTLGLIYQFRKSSVEPKEYIRVCFSWILFLSIGTLFSCNWKGFFGTLIRLIIFCAKAFVVIPLLGGTNKIYKYLIEDGNGEMYYNKVLNIIKTKLSQGGKSLSDSASTTISEHFKSETAEPKNDEQ